MSERNFSFEVVDPDAVEFQMTIRLPLKKWKEVKELLGKTDRHKIDYDFIGAIQDLVKCAEEQFETTRLQDEGD